MALRGLERGPSYCSCPDFRTNTLGTCKHILHVHGQGEAAASTPRRCKKPYRRKRVAVHLHYDDDVTLRLADARPSSRTTSPRSSSRCSAKPIERRPRPAQAAEQAGAARPGVSRSIPTPRSSSSSGWFASRVQQTHGRDPPRSGQASAAHVAAEGAAACRISWTASPSPLGAGRAGPGRRHGPGQDDPRRRRRRAAGPRGRTSARCWSSAPRRSSRSGGTRSTASATATCNLIAGRAAERAPAVRQRLLLHRSATTSRCCATSWPSSRCTWDLIILDEGQRIKNWEAKTTRVIKGLQLAVRPGALRHAAGEPAGRTVLRRAVHRRPAARPGLPLLQPAPRRRREGQGARLQEPGRAAREPAARSCCGARATRSSSSCRRGPTEIVRIPPTDEQLELHDAHMQIVAAIVRKKFLTEMDLLRLRKALLMCRMSADSTFLVDKEAARTIRASWSTWTSCSTSCSPKRAARSCCSPNGRRCST